MLTRTSNLIGRRSLAVVLFAVVALMFGQLGLSAAVGAVEASETEAGAVDPALEVEEPVPAPDPPESEPAPEPPEEEPAPEIEPAPEPELPEPEPAPEPEPEEEAGETETLEPDEAPEAQAITASANQADVCPPMDGKYEIDTGWEGAPAPGITVTSASEGAVTFTVQAGYTLVTICVKTGNGVNAGDWTVAPAPPVVGPVVVTVTSNGTQGAGLSHITFDTEVVVPEDSYSLTLIKLWDPVDGPPSQVPPALPQGFQIVVSGQGQNTGTLTGTYTGNSLVWVGNLEVVNGETVTVSEPVMPAGWTGPHQATASCSSTQNQTGGTDRVCSITLTNAQEAEQPVNGDGDGPEAQVKPQAEEKPKAEVLAEEVRPQEELAFTGIDLLPMAMMALGMAVLGIALLLGGRRRARL